jgi:glycine/D-amino acid oxidase-like deaminating enzyme
MPDGVEVVVLGAGISGAATAYHLVRRSVGPLVLYDPRTPAAGATGRAAGIVSRQLWDRWDVETVRDSEREYAELSEGTDPPLYRTNGFVRWTSDPKVAEALLRAQSRLKGWDVPVEPISPGALHEKLPWVKTDGILAASYCPTDGVVVPSGLAELYARRAEAAGVECLYSRGFRALRREAGRWELTVEGRTVRAEKAVVAAGAWSKQLLRQAGAPLPLAPYRTQAAVLRPPGPAAGSFPSFHDLDRDIYVRPEENGRIMAGDGTRLVEVDPDTAPLGGDDEFVAHLADSFAERCPGWNDSELIRAWSGVCTATPDRRLLVGRVPGVEGLYSLCGFNGFGVMRAAGAARRLVELIASNEGTRAREALSTVDPGRFGPDLPPFVPRPGFTLEGGPDPRF